MTDSFRTGGQIQTEFIFVPTHRHTKGTLSITHPGEKDYTTKKNDRDFHRQGHLVKGTPYKAHHSGSSALARMKAKYPKDKWHSKEARAELMSALARGEGMKKRRKRGGAYDPHSDLGPTRHYARKPPMPDAAKSFAKGAALDMALKGALLGAPILASQVYKRIKRKK